MKVIWLEMFLTIRHDGTDTFWDFWLFFNDYEFIAHWKEDFLKIL